MFPGSLAAVALLALVGACPAEHPADRPADRPVTPPPPKPAPGTKATGPRVIVLGFDGVDPDLVQRWMGEGKLPNLKTLAARGTLRRLQSTTPPQSPVAWASFASGLSPGDHGVFDFIARNPRNYLPSVATVKIARPQLKGGKLLHGMEGENLRSGSSFWRRAGEAGVAGSVLFVPYSFPPDGTGKMRVLSGLGTPDLRGTNSSFQYLARSIFPGGKKAGLTSGGIFVKAQAKAPGFQSKLQGASLKVDGKSKPLDVPIAVAVSKDRLTVSFPGGSASPVTVSRGQWSPLITLSLAPLPDTTWSATTRAYAVPGRDDPLALYFSPISVDPRAPAFPISSPPGFAAELARGLFAPFKTVGWVHETSGLSTESLDDGGFLLDLQQTMELRKRLLLQVLADDHDRLTVAAFTATDRVAHMFYRLLDPKSPRYDAALAKAHGTAIEDTYVQMDRIVGEVVEAIPDDAILLIVSDHGFHSFRRGVNLNRWLIDHGYQTLKAKGGVGRDFFRDVDWAHTRAYAVGTGQIWLNRRGREGRGIVSGENTQALAREIAQGLSKLRDPKAPEEQVVTSVHLRASTYHGARENDAPDLTVSFAEGYRTGWGSILGGAPRDLVEDNTRKWSGDHAASEPGDTEGFLVSNQKIETAKPAIGDVAATVLHLFGIDAGLPGQIWLP